AGRCPRTRRWCEPHLGRDRGDADYADLRAADLSACCTGLVRPRDVVVAAGASHLKSTAAHATHGEGSRSRASLRASLRVAPASTESGGTSAILSVNARVVRRMVDRQPEPSESSVMSHDHAIEAVGLGKTFGATRAVDGIDLRVKRGSIYGLLGPNGAGKTTTVRLLATLLRPDAGRASVLGHDLVREAEAVRRRISLTGQFASVDEDLTGGENLRVLGRLLGFSRAEAAARAAELLAAFDIEEAANREIKTYSGGMRRRLDIAASMLRTPDLLFLDEPTTGLDPRSRGQVWDIIRMLVAGGT